MLAIIDYNMGNLASVVNAFKKIDANAKVIQNPEELKNFDKIILPGVGAFGDAMEHLNKTGMKDAILEFAKSGKYMLGICLGMQLLFEKSQEFGEAKGLSLIEGEVDYFKTSLKVPHMGWNKIFNKENKIFEGLENPYLYFVHSLHAVCDDRYVIGYTHYDYKFVSAVNKDNIYGFQPHPEKSHNNGLKILENFIEL
jgi:glutamine amidotransferase